MFEGDQISYVTEESKSKIKKSRISCADNIKLARRLLTTSLILVIVSLFSKSVVWQPLIFVAGIVITIIMYALYGSAWYLHNLDYFELIEGTAIPILKSLENSEDPNKQKLIESASELVRHPAIIIRIFDEIKKWGESIPPNGSIREVFTEYTTILTKHRGELLISFFSKLNDLSNGNKSAIIKVEDEFKERVRKGTSTDDDEQQVRLDLEQRLAKGKAQEFKATALWFVFAGVTIYGIVLMPQKWFALIAYILAIIVDPVIRKWL